jgi:hypothetical protein
MAVERTGAIGNTWLRLSTLALSPLMVSLFCQPSYAASVVASLIPMQQLTEDSNIALGKLRVGQEFGFSFWAKAKESNVDWAAIIDYRHNGKKSFAFHQKGNEVNHFAFGVHSATGVSGVYATLKPEEWQHVAIVKSLGSLAIYVNGDKVDRVALKSSYKIDYAGDEVLTIGGWGYGGRRWLGTVSCLYVFDGAMSEREVKALSKQSECKKERN